MFVCMVMFEQVTDRRASGERLALDPFVQLAMVDAALDDLAFADTGALERDWFIRYARSVDEVLARIDAIAIDVAAEAQQRGHDRELGFLSTKAYLKHHVQLTGPEAHNRIQTVRMFQLLPEWATAARTGEVGVAQTRLMARVAANPRLHLALTEHANTLLTEAVVESYDEFERRLRDFARSADQTGAEIDAQQHHQARDASMRQHQDGSWRMWGTFGSLQGAEINEIFAHFAQAEWDSDWAEAHNRLGDTATMADLRRLEPQRRADAIAATFVAAAAAPTGGAGPLPTLNVVIDETTLEAAVTGSQLDPARFADLICQTSDGAPIDLSEAAGLAMWAHIRRVVRDSSSVVIDMGRRSRLFTGSAREAVLLLEDRCSWPGCDQPTRHCQADHSIGWKAHGCTVPRNGGPMCRAHNLLKERGSFTARRGPDGNWTIRDADGNTVD